MSKYSILAEMKVDASETATRGPEQNFDITKIFELANEAQEKTFHMQEVATLAKYLHNASNETGNQVILSKDYGFLPGLVGKDRRFVPLFNFIEVLDESIDYDLIIEAFPSLSYSQINGAMFFLKKINQFNIKGCNIEQYLDDKLSDDEGFLSEIREAFFNQGGQRVLDFDK